MLYWDYSFEITANGLKLTDKDTQWEKYQQVKIENTPLQVGDTFTLLTDNDGCMFFRKNAPVQYELNFGI
tara:strand:- start:305 stop:514 length:210 start_codon:yes stop_codon:yes gene_type:complete